VGADAGFHDYVMGQLEGVPDVSSRKMFGGYGLYAGGMMFGLISSDDAVYFKADDANRPDYEAAGGEQFMNMPYFAVPIEPLDDPDALATWAEGAIAAAERTKKKR